MLRYLREGKMEKIKAKKEVRIAEAQYRASINWLLAVLLIVIFVGIAFLTVIIDYHQFISAIKIIGIDKIAP